MSPSPMLHGLTPCRLSSSERRVQLLPVANRLRLQPVQIIDTKANLSRATKRPMLKLPLNMGLRFGFPSKNRPRHGAQGEISVAQNWIQSSLLPSITRICTRHALYLSSDCTNPSQLPLPVNLSTTRSWSSSSIASSGYRQRVVLIQCILWLNSQDCFLHKLQPGLATVSQLYSYCTGMIGMVAVRPSAGSVGFVAQPDSTIAVINAKISP